MPTYEFIQSKPSAALSDAIADSKTRTDDQVVRVLKTFQATDDPAAKAKVVKLFQDLPNINLTTPYECREKGTNRLLVFDEEASTQG